MRKNLLILVPVILGIIGVIAGGGCNSTAGTTTTTTAVSIIDINVQDSRTLLQDNKDNPHFIILDIRTPDEFATGHLEKAQNIDYYAADFRARIDKLSRTETYFIYCRTGHRSGLARDMMKEMGFLHIYNMTGGINDWTAAGNPVVYQ
jgi:rhodanese-related sulfurtransferase